MLCLMYYLSIKQFLENVVFKLNDCCCLLAFNLLNNWNFFVIWRCILHIQYNVRVLRSCHAIFYCIVPALVHRSLFAICDSCQKLIQLS